MKDFFGRAPFVFIGALGLLSFTRGLVEWQADLAVVIDAYRTVSQAIWDFFTVWTGWKLLWWWADYLTLGLIAFSAMIRSTVQFSRETGQKVFESFGTFVIYLPIILFWPFITLTLILMSTSTNSGMDDLDRKGVLVYFESFIWALIIIALNYALIFAGTTIA